MFPILSKTSGGGSSKIIVMEYLDINGDELYVGAVVNVPPPTRNEDSWLFDFEGVVIKLDREINSVIVEDGDGDCYVVECELLELA